MQRPGGVFWRAPYGTHIPPGNLPAGFTWPLPFINISRRCSMKSARSAARRRQAESVPCPSRPSDYIRSEGLSPASTVEFVQVSPEPVNVHPVAHAIHNPARVCILSSRSSLVIVQPVEGDSGFDHLPVVFVPRLAPSVYRTGCESNLDTVTSGSISSISR